MLKKTIIEVFDGNDFPHHFDILPNHMGYWMLISYRISDKSIVP